jgi:hypothetical protein
MSILSNGMMLGWVGVVADLEGVDEIGRGERQARWKW